MTRVAICPAPARPSAVTAVPVADKERGDDEYLLSLFSPQGMMSISPLSSPPKVWFKGSRQRENGEKRRKRERKERERDREERERETRL